MPDLVRIQATYADAPLAVLGVTESSADEALEFAREYSLNFPVLAGAEESNERYGVDMIWGSVLFLVDPEDRIVADSLRDAEAILLGELGR